MENKIIAILRLDSPQKAQKGIEALKKGGIQAIEVTLNTPGALQVISHYQNVSDLLIGAGTVLDEASCLMQFSMAHSILLLLHSMKVL